ncbi:hypothetical protein ACFQ0P_13930 [Microbacterium insulae]|uniref:DUF222 domain-containing protein n=1 Tax=Microbacterium insulae TaxID=483014 RepID=A0ABW3AKK2_9MICO
MTTTNTYRTAYRAYRDELGAAMQMSDPDLSAAGLSVRQRARRESARERLLAARPALPSVGTSRADVLGSLRPTTADQISRMQHEQAHVLRMLEAGRALGQIIANADDVRALAIADLVETLPQTLESQHGDEIIAETHGLVFERLADLGVESAVQAREFEQSNAPALAWHRAMTEAAEGSDASVGAWQDVYRADAKGYEAARAGLDGNVDEWVRRFDLANA